jgi:hypothetical protein
MTDLAWIMTWFISTAVVVALLVGGGVLIASRGRETHYNIHLPHPHLRH